jgi:hypothetical protein
MIKIIEKQIPVHVVTYCSRNFHGKLYIKKSWYKIAKIFLITFLNTHWTLNYIIARMTSGVNN